MTTLTTAPGNAAANVEPSTATPFRFFAADDFDTAARTVLGRAGQGMMSPGLVLTTLERVIDGDCISWYRAWYSTAETLRAQAVVSSAAGYAVTGNAFHLAAAEAYGQALAFIAGMPDDTPLLPTFRLHRQCWDAFIAGSAGRHLPVSVPFETGPMPGYLLRPDASSAARPTVVVTNSSDGALTGLWATIIKGALKRDWNVFVFDGPGQQSMLFERGVPFRHDWEAVLTPVVDLLVARTDVDAAGLLAYGLSQGGFWLPRALAFEHRFVAAVVDAGVVDVARPWNVHLPPPLLALLRCGDADPFNRRVARSTDPAAQQRFDFRARPYGQPTPYDLFVEVSRYTLAGVVDQITTPLLITDPDDEQLFPGQPSELFESLSCPKTLVRFTADQGAAGHGEPMARHLLDLRIGDFFADELTKSRT